MDADTWNAYHIVSNRARSVCYATRQQHFRRRAEVTVNALIATATNQLDAMKDLKVQPVPASALRRRSPLSCSQLENNQSPRLSLSCSASPGPVLILDFWLWRCPVSPKEGQRELKELTAASLERLLLGHDALREQQGQLQVGQEQMETSIASNLQRLDQERALIASGQELVARLIQGITQRMGEEMWATRTTQSSKPSPVIDLPEHDS